MWKYRARSTEWLETTVASGEPIWVTPWWARKLLKPINTKDLARIRREREYVELEDNRALKQSRHGLTKQV